MSEPFRFNEDRVNNVEDLIETCQKFPDEAINYLLREDFEKWLVYIDRIDLANYAEQARKAPVSDEEKLQQFIANCQKIKSDLVTNQPKKSQKSTNLLSKIKEMIFGNRQKTQEQTLSTE